MITSSRVHVPMLFLVFSEVCIWRPLYCSCIISFVVVWIWIILSVQAVFCNVAWLSTCIAYYSSGVSNQSCFVTVRWQRVALIMSKCVCSVVNFRCIVFVEAGIHNDGCRCWMVQFLLGRSCVLFVLLLGSSLLVLDRMISETVLIVPCPVRAFALVLSFGVSLLIFYPWFLRRMGLSCT